MDSGRLKGIIMVITGASLWGLSGTAAQQLFQQENVSTEWLVTIRLLISGIILLLFSSFGSKKSEVLGIWKQKAEANKIILFGLLGMLAVQYTYFASIQEGNAAVATLLQYLAPIFITVYLIFKWNIRPTKIDFISIVLSLIGTFFLLTNGSIDNLAVSTPAIVWGILSGLSLAFYSLYSKELLEKWSSSVIVGWGMIIGGVGVTVLHFLSTNEFILLSGMKYFQPNNLFLITFVVIFGTLIAFYLYLDSIRYLTPKETTLFGCTEPLAAIISSILILHVPFQSFQFLGALCIIVMVLVLSQKPDEGKPKLRLAVTKKQNIK
ncbi:EamA family transporter [Bacillus pseudomycoides]|jgi:drug/metabolite transporter (DMT)-like permease|uniref:EamA family transporter n=3 Tax=Bacillus pseudomycoides TaxID=64104 RepID=A0A2H3MEJ8_9BACI|nr:MULTISPECIES: EamA family transporter [Bacillus]AIK38587.1 eamA-like transporter family protein [Bacillus pseudomycoides]AJI19731.1 eamA-like transporter family protein [Bacillus pseudomycoides]EEM06045.1 Transporter, drug/metabolite exporter [Bacillus pseudomycoides]EEM11845.1 Transporter, drug/metabolite exporter [Bacillus pseudomycoides]EEM17899.1 Transporter, drug/metabolite exporter [Bacillus pseudomycoides DSM 12442]